MSGRWNQILGIVLVIQVALVAFTHWPRSADDVQSHPLVSFARDAITEIEITAGGDPQSGSAKPEESVFLTNKGTDGWIISNAHDYPADPAKVTELLDKLSALTVKKPVATQETSQSSLKVADKDFGRKVRLKAGADELTFYVGAARSNAVNVRKAGEKEVYEAKGVSEYQLKNSARGFYDSSYTNTPFDSIDRFTLKNPSGTFSLVRMADKSWVVEGAEATPIDRNEVDSLVRRIATVRMSEPAGKDATPDMGLDGSVRAEWTTTETPPPAEDGTQGEPVVRKHGLTVGAVVETMAYVKSDENAFVVKTYDSGMKPLRESTVASLAPKPAELDPEAEAMMHEVGH
jgi:hypothetical protein